MARSFRGLVVDDFEPLRRSISSSIKEVPSLGIVDSLEDGAEAVQKAAELQPHLVLLDIGLPTLTGIEVARRISRTSPCSKTLFVVPWLSNAPPTLFKRP